MGRVLCGLIVSSTYLALITYFVPSFVPIARAGDRGTNGSATSSQQCADSKLTTAEINEILQIHNQARSKVGVAPLEWDCTLAKYAQQWADRDQWKHSSDDDYRSLLPSNYTFTGENLAVVAGARQQVVRNGPLMWLAEQSNWNPTTAECKTGKVCSHYTQVVWRKTTKVGCGINRNATVMGARWKGQTQFLSCNYNPAGNVMGQKPY